MSNKLWLMETIFVLWIVMVGCIKQPENGSECLEIKNWAIQLQDADPDIIATSGFELVVID